MKRLVYSSKELDTDYTYEDVYKSIVRPNPYGRGFAVFTVGDNRVGKFLFQGNDMNECYDWKDNELRRLRR